MALSGNLKEFELADVFQLIGQQHKTGVLSLKHKNKQGSIHFQNGRVIAASSPEADIASILFTYLSTVKEYPLNRIQQFYDFCNQSDKMFADILLKIQYLNEEELTAITAMSIEDISCSLFKWKSGTYRFLPAEDMSLHAIHDLYLQTDAVCMEAMRRQDEWPRLRKHINDSMIFIHSGDPNAGLPQRALPHVDPTFYLYSLIDGTKSVRELCESTFLCKYRIYEILYQLLYSSAITQHSGTLSSFTASRPISFFQSNPTFFRLAGLTAAAIITISTAAVVLASLLDPLPPRATSTLSHAMTQAHNKLQRARLRFHAMRGRAAISMQELFEERVIAPRDVAPLPEGQRDSPSQ